MSAIPARDLRNHTAEVLRRVEAGEEIEVLRDNRPVAKIVPLSRRRRWLPASEITQELARLGPDSTGLAVSFEWGISAITLGELRLGVLQAANPDAASRRLSTYQLAQRFEALPVDEPVSDACALLVSRLRAVGRKVPINDSWIAATAIAHGIPVVTGSFSIWGCGIDDDSGPGRMYR